MHYLLDTNHASALFLSDADLVRQVGSLPTDDKLSLCRPSIAELWYMIHNSARVEVNRAQLIAFLPDYNVVELDAGAAEEYGVIRTELRRLGRPIPIVDVLIAAIARHHDLVLLSRDKHFDRVRGLRTENWLAP